MPLSHDLSLELLVSKDLAEDLLITTEVPVLFCLFHRPLEEGLHRPYATHRIARVEIALPELDVWVLLKSNIRIRFGAVDVVWQRRLRQKR